MNEDDEIFDVVDSQDQIIGKATRHQVHNYKLMHRSSHVLVFDLSENLFLQKRAMKKVECPGLWDSSAAGHVESGEGYIKCAIRELKEELGLERVWLTEIMSIPAQYKTFWEHVRVYACITNNKIFINHDEISEGRFFELPEVAKLVESKLGIFASTFIYISKNYICK